MPKKDKKQQEVVSPLRILRERANLTQEQLGVRLGVAGSTIRRWESGTEPAMTRRQWKIFCQETGVIWDELPDDLSILTPIESEVS
jgi:transcriptional regulator with XRE-family HTH domain